MANSTRTTYTDPRFRSSGKLGSEEWESECEISTGGFLERMSWKTVLLSVLGIAAAVVAVMLVS